MVFPAGVLAAGLFGLGLFVGRFAVATGIPLL
jgi:hypothetical protein